MTFAPLSSVRLTGGPLLDSQEAGRRYVFALDPDRLLAPFLREAGLSPRKPSYGNWESSGLDGHIGGHYLSALALLVASTGDIDARDRLRYMIDELARAQAHLGTGYIGGVPNSRQLWDEVRSGITADTFSRDGRWVPWYNLHKTYAGLLDAHRFAAVDGALDVLLRLADWWEELAAGIDEDRFQLMLATEFGGMNDVYSDLYEATGDERHARMARRFTRRALLDPLAIGVDELTGLHANTQIPQVVGFARLARLTDDADLAAAAAFFWETVVHHRSVSIGGNSVREHFHAASDFTPMIEDREGPETCNTYNMVKLSAELFTASDDAADLDYVERALYNHLLSSQHPDHGGLVYFTSMRPGHYRNYSTVDDCHWCCVGTGIETHARHGATFYASDSDTVSVLQFAPSTLELPTLGLLLMQDTRFPNEQSVRLTLALDTPREFSLRIRRPSWLAGDPTVRVNGSTVEALVVERNFLVLRRAWEDGDVVDVELPMTITVERLPDGSDWATLRYGPIVLAARTEDLDPATLLGNDARMGHIATGRFSPLADAPILTPADVAVMQRDESGSLAFRIPSSRGTVLLEPFGGLHDARYVVYFPWAEDGAVARRREALEAQDRHALTLDAQTLDAVALGEQQPESDHGFAGTGLETGAVGDLRWRSTRESLEVVLNDFHQLGSTLRISMLRSPRSAEFEIEVNGEVLAHERIGEVTTEIDTPIEIEIELPPLTDDALHRRVRIGAAPGSWSGRVTSIRLLR
ncbi:glycoside hydrolase family 127 protein [Agromyces albus]|uniref:Glycosyl hydrolase n=1 Tax=Agromyces albus TaxID=205332 RepID=A0A4Q2L077_9MICO|nr:glycoside hydrolase family 127 protein [Agromyces albus]RXZ70270.1 glycosyl hydrolase [Agromyces albus]